MDSTASPEVNQLVHDTLKRFETCDAHDRPEVFFDHIVTRAAGQRMAAGEVRLTLANASHYMTLLGHLSIGWMWLWQAVVAARALPTASEHDRAFYEGKLQACRFFFATELPQIELAARLVSEAEPSAYAMRDEWF